MVMLKLEDQPPLIQAIFSGEIEDVRALLEIKADVNYQDVEKRSPLHAAAYRGDRDLAELLLEQGARVNSKDSKWLTPLHRACGVGADELVELLLRYKADTTARDRQWQTPLHIAAATNAVACIQHLLNHITNVNVTDRAGCTALHHAALNGHVEVVELLLSSGSIVNACDKKDCRPIHWAAHLGHVDTVNLLIKKGADINVKDRNQYTPLHAAAASGMVYVCRVLLSAGADVNAQNSFGNTPLHIACLNGHLSVCQILLSHRANVEAVNYKGQTPLHISAVSTQGVGCLAYLLEQENVDINKQSNDGRTPLHMSAIYGRFTRSKRLIDKGAVVDCADKNGNTALHIAAQYGHDILTATLLDFGAEPTKRGYQGRTPLHVSCLSGYVEVCRKFLQASVDLNVVDDHGRTPIHCAAYKGSVECLDLLVSRGGNFKLQDSIGRTALHYAASRGHYNCVYTLVGIGSPVNLLDLEGCSALHLASAFDYDGKCVEYLLQHKADPLLKDNNGFTPVHYAVNGSNSASLELLLKNCKNANFLIDMPSTTPLHLAARHADLNILRVIMSYFPDTNIKTKEGYTPLLIAAREGHTANVQMLLRYGAKVAICDDVNGMSPVHYSAKNGHLHCLALLVDNAEVKSVIDKQDNYKRTALMLAISGSHQECAFTLIKSNSDPNIVDADLHSSLFRAVVTDQNYVVQLLIGRGANLTSPDINGKTVLHLAAACGHLKCVQKILKSISEEDALALDKNGFSALHWACYYGNTSCLDFLLQQNICKQMDGNVFTPMHCAAFTGSERCLELLFTKFGEECVKAVDTRNRTPLHLAAWHGHADCVRYLLDNGGDVEARDELGRTALISAAQNGQSQVIDLLLAHKADLKASDTNGSTALHVACLRKHNHTALLLLEYIDDIDIINMVDNDKKTALHLSARNGLVEVTAELIKKGASVLAADNNGLTPALYCAPNACVAQCLAIILANHPVEFPEKNQQIKETLNLMKRLLRLASPRQTSSSRLLQTDISLMRNPQELFLVDDNKLKRRKSTCTCGNYTVTKTKPPTQTKSCDSEFPKTNDPILSPEMKPCNSNNLILIENYDLDDFDVSKLKSQRGGLGLHRSFSEIALVQEDFGQMLCEEMISEEEAAVGLSLSSDDNIDIPGLEEKASFLPDHDEEALKEAAYEKLINGYKSIAMKMAEITNQYDVSIDDIQKAYIEQYALKKNVHWNETQKQFESYIGNYDNEADASNEPVRENRAIGLGEDVLKLATSASSESFSASNASREIIREFIDVELPTREIRTKKTTVEVPSEKPVQVAHVSFVSPLCNIEKNTENAASSGGCELTATCIGTTTDHDPCDTFSQGDWLYESSSNIPNRYCDCEYVCPNCVLMNRYDQISFEQGEAEFKRLISRDDFIDEEENDNGRHFRYNSYEFPNYGQRRSQASSLNLFLENGDIDIANDPIPLENLIVLEPRHYVGEGAVRKSRINRDILNYTEFINADKLEKASRFLKDKCHIPNDLKQQASLIQINEKDEIESLIENIVESDKECNELKLSSSDEQGFWPKITFDNGCVKMPKDLQKPLASKVDDNDVDLELDPSRDLDWSLFTDCLDNEDFDADKLAAQAQSQANSIIDTSFALITDNAAKIEEVEDFEMLSDIANPTVEITELDDDLPPTSSMITSVATIPRSKCSISSIATSFLTANALNSGLKLNEIPPSLLQSLPGPSCAIHYLNPFKQSKLFGGPGIIEFSSYNIAFKKNRKKSTKSSVTSTTDLNKQESNLLSVFQAAQSNDAAVNNLTYQQFMEMSERLNMSNEAKAIAQHFIEQLNMQSKVVVQETGTKREKKKIFGLDVKGKKRIKEAGSDSGIESASLESLHNISTSSSQSSNVGVASVASILTEQCGDSRVVMHQCTKKLNGNKLKRIKRQDDNKCCLT